MKNSRIKSLLECVAKFQICNFFQSHLMCLYISCNHYSLYWLIPCINSYGIQQLLLRIHAYSFLSVLLIIKEQYIIIIRTFPESFAAGKSLIPNNLVSLRAARPPRCLKISLTINLLLYKTRADDIIGHVTLLTSALLLTVTRLFLLLKKKSTWFESQWCESFRTAQVPNKI